jgi:hypothetical protein
MERKCCDRSPTSFLTVIPTFQSIFSSSIGSLIVDEGVDIALRIGHLPDEDRGGQAKIDVFRANAFWYEWHVEEGTRRPTSGRIAGQVWQLKENAEGKALQWKRQNAIGGPEAARVPRKFSRALPGVSGGSVHTGPAQELDSDDCIDTRSCCGLRCKPDLVP